MKLPNLSLGVAMIAGLAIREIIAPFTGHPFDFEIWVRLGVFMQTLQNPYSLLPFVPGLSFSPTSAITSISYPPLPAFLFGATYWAFQALGSPSPFLYYFLLKQPMVFADVATGFLIFRLVGLNFGKETATKAAAIWLFLPFTIIVSSMWGALDPVSLALLLASVYAIFTKRPLLSGLFLGVSIYMKLMPVIFIPAFLIAGGLSLRGKGSFTLASLSIPLFGTVAPFLFFGWSFSGIFSAVTYQGSLPDFGGMGIFNVLSMLVPRGFGPTSLLAWAWVPALVASYAIAYVRKSGLVEALLVTVILFSVFRPVLPEQWAVYPLAFLLVSKGVWNRTSFLGLAVVASLFLVTNNLLLVRFFAPVSPGALAWDQAIDASKIVSDIRFALLLAFSTMYCAEAFSVVANRKSLLASKFKQITRINLHTVAVPGAYIVVVSVAGGFLDFTATKMVTNWALATQAGVFLGLSWLSLYHIMLVAVFETAALLIAMFSRRGLKGSTALFIELTALNFIAAGFSLMIYRALDGASVLASTPIYLAGSFLVTEVGFVVFTFTLGALGIFYLNEVKGFFLLLFRVGAPPSPVARAEHADSLPPTA